ncbi:MAG: hypothetical protein CME38_18915 [Haliea sp.]|nr:hypothetical protein [Haliea sp.]
MAIKDRVVELVLRARNMMSGDTDAAAQSVDKLAGSAGDLQERLRELQDQGTLLKQFERASKAVDTTSAAYDRAQVRLDKLAAKLDTTGPLTERQAREFAAAQAAVDRAEKAYRNAEGTLGTLAKEAEDAGLDVSQLSEAQRENQRQTTATKRALEDYNKELEQGESRLQRFGKSLAAGVASFAKWATAAAAAGAAGTAALLARMTANQAELARQTIASAEAFGISTKALQEWRYAADTVGIEGDKVADIMKDVSDKIGDAFLNGTGAAVDVIRQLNLDLEELIRLSPDEQLLAISEQLQGLPQPAQVQILESLAGDASLLLPLLQNNAAALRELSAEAEKRGVLLSEEELQRLADFDKAFDRIKDQFTAFKNRIAGELAPTLTDLSNNIDQFLTDNPQLIGDIVDAFEGLITTTSNWVNKFLGDSDAVYDSFSTLKNGATGLKESFVALLSGLKFFAAGIAEVFAMAVYDVAALQAKAVELLNKVGLASDESVKRAQERVANLALTLEDVRGKGEKYKQDMIEAGKAAAAAFLKASEGAASSAKETDKAASGAKNLADATKDAGRAAETAAAQTESLAQTQMRLRQEVAALVPEIKAAQAEFARDATTENQRRLQALIKEYDALVERIQSLNSLSGQTSEGIRTSSEVLKDSVDAVNKSLQDSTGQTREFVRVVNTGFGDSEQRLKDFAETTESTANSVGASLSGVISGWMQHISRLSQSALAAFKTALGARGAGEVTSELEARLAAVNNRIDEMQGRLRAGGAVGKVLRDWAQAGFEIEQSFLEQSIAVRDLTQAILDGDRSANVLRMTTEQIRQQFDLLDDQQLSGLLNAVGTVQQEVESLRQSLMDTFASLRQELAGLKGDTAQVEELRYLERRAELEAQYQYARRLGDREAQDVARQSLHLLEQAHQIRLRDAKAQDEVTRKAAAERAAQEEQRRQLDEREERQDISRQTSQQLASQSRSQTTTRVVELRVVGQNGQQLATLNAVDDGNVEQFLDAIERSAYLAPGG